MGDYPRIWGYATQVMRGGRPRHARLKWAFGGPPGDGMERGIATGAGSVVAPAGDPRDRLPRQRSAVRRRRLARPWPEHIDGEREHDGVGALARNIEQRPEIAQ